MSFHSPLWPRQFSIRSALLAVAIAFGALPLLALSPAPPKSTTYLPLKPGNKWVLRSAKIKQPATIEVLAREGAGYRIRFSHPWGMNEWLLVPRGNKYYLTGFGMTSELMPLPDDTLYFDFTAASGAEWKNAVGTIKVNDTNASVRGSGNNYDHCVRITQTSNGSSFVMTFAGGRGFVEWEAGGIPFVIDDQASTVGAGSDPTPAAPTPTPATPPSTPKRPEKSAGSGRVLYGVMANAFANEKASPENIMRHYNDTLDLGVKYLVGNGRWPELEPTKGNFQLESLAFQVSEAKRHNLKTSFTFRIVENINRVLPKELANKRWNDPEMRSRVFALIDAMAPYLKQNVSWFMFGYELDSYFIRHPGEMKDFAELYRDVSAHVKQKVPGIEVSSTSSFLGSPWFGSTMKPLIDQVDFLALTYTPLTPDMTMEEPSVAIRDMEKMVDLAHGRQIVLQEISYSTSALNNGSEDKQAQFYQNVFNELKAHSDVFVAASFGALADLSDDYAAQLAGYFGLPKNSASVAMLQTLGMYDVRGKPKKSWAVFERELKR